MGYTYGSDIRLQFKMYGMLGGRLWSKAEPEV